MSLWLIHFLSLVHSVFFFKSKSIWYEILCSILLQSFCNIVIFCFSVSFSVHKCCFYAQHIDCSYTRWQELCIYFFKWNVIIYSILAKYKHVFVFYNTPMTTMTTNFMWNLKYILSTLYDKKTQYDWQRAIIDHGEP